jgi:hypothetical protein
MAKPVAKATKAQEAKAAPAQKKIEKKAAKPVAKAAKKINKVAKNYFTVGEDNTILEYVKRGEKKTKTEVSKELAAKLGRPLEAVRDRIKRYITKINQADQAHIVKEAKRNPKQYVFFKKNADGSKKIEKITNVEPLLQNRDIKRKPRQSKAKKPVPKKAVSLKKPEDKITWIAQKLQDKDQYFKLDFSVQLLTDIFNVLIEEEKVSINAIENLISSTFSNLTLDQIFEQLKVKKTN